MSFCAASDVYALATTFPEGTAVRWSYDVDGKKRGGGALEDFRTHPDSREQPGVSKGTAIPQPRWRSQIFAGTVQDWSIYLPALYHPDQFSKVLSWIGSSTNIASGPTLREGGPARFITLAHP